MDFLRPRVATKELLFNVAANARTLYDLVPAVATPRHCTFINILAARCCIPVSDPADNAGSFFFYNVSNINILTEE